MNPVFPRRLVHLDMLRGLAALAVVIGHLRGFIFVDYRDLASPDLISKAFYAMTGLGHQAVIAFFALSGFLVGGKALQDMLNGSWSWPAYMVARLSRLWTVVVPALLLTLVFDLAGRALGGGAGYAGAYFELLSSGPSIDKPADNSLITFVANIAFLQTVTAPVFGTNGPLWSLANEFWYYVVFPLVASAILVPDAIGVRVLLAVAALGLALVLPLELMLLGAIWVAGAGVHYLGRAPVLARVFANPFYVIVMVIAVCAAIVAPRLAGTAGATLGSNLALGCAWALLLPGLAALPSPGWLYERVALGLSEISYTLYATHYPLLAFIWFSALAPAQSLLGFSSIALAVSMLSMTLVFAAVTWWCFERHTYRVRKAFLGTIGAGVPSAKDKHRC